MSGEFGVSPLSLPDGVQVLCASDHLRTGLQSLLHQLREKAANDDSPSVGSEEWAELSSADDVRINGRIFNLVCRLLFRFTDAGNWRPFL